MKFAEFNRIANPNDTACYIVETSNGIIKDARFSDILNILKVDDDAVVKMKIPKGLLLLEVENEKIIEVIEKLNEKVLVTKINNKYYIYTLSSFDKNTLNNVLACGVNANTITYSIKAGSEVLLPFHSPTNKSPIYKTISIEYENGLGKIPYWLTPLKRSSSVSQCGLDIPLVNNVEKLLLNHVLNIQGLTKEEQKNLLEFINENLVFDPLSDKKLALLMESISDSILEQFMNKSEFYHDKFGDYVIEACHIKKDSVSHKLFFYNNKKNIYTSEPEFLRGYITRLCPRLKKFQKDEVVQYISDYLEYDSVEFNSNEFNIVFKNGILNVETMEFEEMNQDHLESIQIDAEWDPSAYCDTADEFFKTATCGDAVTEQLLYEAIGYSMLKTNQLAKAFMLVGEGRNGKSTYLDIIKAILGKANYASLSLKDMSNTFRVSQLKDKLASLAGDISAQPISDSDLLKSISAGEDITIEQKYKDSYTSSLYSTLFYACNKLPKTPDTSDGYYRRWCIIPFNADLTKISNVDGFAFKKRLLSQESINYIAYKAVNAIYKVFNTTKDFTVPNSVASAIEAYKISNSSLLSWFVDYCDKDADRIKRLGLDSSYERYTEWCKDANRPSMSKTNYQIDVKRQLKIDFDEK